MDDPDGVVLRLALRADVPEDAWRTRLDWTGCFKGVPGLDDKFIHCSTTEQVVGTAAAYFAGKEDVLLLQLSVSLMREADLEVRWEDAAPGAGVTKRDGDFPHVYGGPIPYACLAVPPATLALDSDGKHIFPWTLAPAQASTSSGMALEVSEEGQGLDGFTAEQIREENEGTQWLEDHETELEVNELVEDAENSLDEQDYDDDVY